MSFEKRTLRVRGAVACLVALTFSCGPRDGSGGGEAGGGGDAGSGAGGSGAVSGASGAGGSGGVSGVSGAAGGGGAAGASGAAGTPGVEPVIGCPAASWPDDGFYFEAPPAGELGDDAAIILERFSALGISGDGRTVVGNSHDPGNPNPRPVAASFTLAGGAVLLPPGAEPSGEADALLASCDGSVIVEQETFFGLVYRVEAGRTELTLGNQPPRDTLHMDPSGARIIDGTGRRGYSDETGEIPAVPQEWTAATGAVFLTPLTDTQLHHVSSDGSLIGADADELFRYSRATGAREPIGMAPVAGGNSIVVSANGNAWIESADTHLDSFLVWRPPAEPRSVTCSAFCRPVDLSSTGEVALIDVAPDGSGASLSTSIWTERDGLVDLAEFLRRFGVEPGAGRQLRAVAISDDARAIAGYSLDPTGASASFQFFYAVVPIAAYR